MSNKVRQILLMDDHVCPWWLCFTFDNPLRRLIHNPDRLLRSWIAPGQTAIDIGCGMGYFTLPMARLVGNSGRVIAVDLQAQMLDRLQRRAERGFASAHSAASLPAGHAGAWRTGRFYPDVLDGA